MGITTGPTAGLRLCGGLGLAGVLLGDAHGMIFCKRDLASSSSFSFWCVNCGITLTTTLLATEELFLVFSAFTDNFPVCFCSNDRGLRSVFVVVGNGWFSTSFSETF